MEKLYNVIPTNNVPIKSWTKGLEIEEEALKQLKNVASLPFIYKWVAAMPDVHAGSGATIGSVIPSKDIIIPAAVGVDIGCGMMAFRTTLSANDLPDNLGDIRSLIEGKIPHGRTNNGGVGDRGAWGNPPIMQQEAWDVLSPRFKKIIEKHPKIEKSNNINHLGTLGTGNHFIELCLDENDCVWVMLHSGSRGVGACIGNYFIDLAKQDMKRYHIDLPDPNLAYFPRGSMYFDDYLEAVSWAQDYAMKNRELMVESIEKILVSLYFNSKLPKFKTNLVINCHHNYVSRENHYGENVFITRKGAIRARLGDMGIIPGSMGTSSYIVKGLQNEESFHSCSHGAGRTMSRTKARHLFTIEDHIKATKGIECRKDLEVIDETPMAYKDIDLVMEAQKDLVEVVHKLHQLICIKG
jgi:tRNA-splicing ligase RtcB